MGNGYAETKGKAGRERNARGQIGNRQAGEGSTRSSGRKPNLSAKETEVEEGEGERGKGRRDRSEAMAQER